MKTINMYTEIKSNAVNMIDTDIHKLYYSDFNINNERKVLLDFLGLTLKGMNVSVDSLILAMAPYNKLFKTEFYIFISNFMTALEKIEISPAKYIISLEKKMKDTGIAIIIDDPHKARLI